MKSLLKFLRARDDAAFSRARTMLCWINVVLLIFLAGLATPVLFHWFVGTSVSCGCQ